MREKFSQYHPRRHPTNTRGALGICMSDRKDCPNLGVPGRARWQRRPTMRSVHAFCQPCRKAIESKESKTA